VGTDLNFGADPHSPITNHYSGSPCTTYRLDSMNPRENLHVMEGGACFQRWVVCRLSVKQSTTERAFTLDAHLLHVLHQEYQPSAQKKKTAPTNRCSWERSLATRWLLPSVSRGEARVIERG